MKKRICWPRRGLAGSIVMLLLMGLGGTVFPQEHEVASEEGEAVSDLPSLDSQQAGQETFERLYDSDAPPRFQYKSRNGRDPFVSFVSPLDKDLRGLPPLQRVAVSELKLIGVARSSGKVSAMLQTPDGKSYPVSRGTRVGNNKGRVGYIGEDSIAIEEPYLNIFGRTALRQVVMKLYVKKEE